MKPRKLAKIYFIFFFCFAMPAINFIFFHPYYDHGGDWFYLIDPLKESRIISNNSKIIRQSFFSMGDNLSRIVILARLNKPTNLKLDLFDNSSKNIRSITKLFSKNQTILWDFSTVEHSNNREFVLEIRINDEQKDGIIFNLYSIDQVGYDITINDKLESGKTLGLLTESKFPNSKEKIRTLLKRIIIYRPKFIQILFFPVFALYIILSVFIFIRLYNNFYTNKNQV